jgi:phosphoribosylamine--glycine ligase
MGRDEAVAERLMSHELHVLGQWQNPGLSEKAALTGGEFHLIDSITNVELVTDLVQAIEPDMFFTNFDDSLKSGVVDTIIQRVKNKQLPEILIPAPNKRAAKVEWDKFYLRKIIEDVGPNYNPINFMAETLEAAETAIRFFEDSNMQIALKPRNLTGGKGVKVQGKHFKTYQQAKEYASNVLNDRNQSGIEIQEKLNGHEFTLQLWTDGTRFVNAPATYDYPYREDGDYGPGTGGMGAFSMKDGLLPFIDKADIKEACSLINRILTSLRNRGHEYKGIIYPTFFKTHDGLKIVEINARGGDPELINILDLLEDDVDLADALTQIAQSELNPDSIRYKKLASAVVYLVSPNYGYKKGPPYKFRINNELVENTGSRIRFAAAERIGKRTYQTVGSSRSVGLSALGETPWEARAKIDEAIEQGFGMPLHLEYRKDIASQDYINQLTG